MTKTREQLRHLLHVLDDAMPGLMEDNPDRTGLWSAFTYVANDIHSQTCTDDHEWVTEQLDAIQRYHGMATPTTGRRTHSMAA
jgi:hypothetical protein